MVYSDLYILKTELVYSEGSKALSNVSFSKVSFVSSNSILGESNSLFSYFL